MSRFMLQLPRCTYWTGWGIRKRVDDLDSKVNADAKDAIGIPATDVS